MLEKRRKDKKWKERGRLAKTMPLSGRARLPPNVRRLPLGTIAHKTSSQEEFPLSQPNREHEIERANLPHRTELWSRLTEGPKPDFPLWKPSLRMLAGEPASNKTYSISLTGPPAKLPLSYYRKYPDWVKKNLFDNI